MHCPSLEQLPPPPPGKTGWPWTEESPKLPDIMPDGLPWPKISIITPSFNQGQFIEETIRSVLLQGYPNLEYIIIDGKSTDNSVEIIRKYEKWLTYWVSESDGGQSNAINKGLVRANGELVAWLNSDDTYYPGALQTIAVAFSKRPDIGLFYGACDLVDEKGLRIRTKGGPWDYARLLRRCYIGQPATFINKKLLGSMIYLDESLWQSLDWELWIRLGLLTSGHFISVPLATARMWEGCKTFKSVSRHNNEHSLVLKRLWKQNSFPSHLRYQASAALAENDWNEGKFNIQNRAYFHAAKSFILALRYNPPFLLRHFIYAGLVTTLPKPLQEIGIGFKKKWCIRK